MVPILALAPLLAVLFQFPFSDAQNLVVGHGRSVEASDVQFGLDLLQDNIEDIVDSVGMGPNRSVGVSLPVQKVYGVNVSFLLFLRR
jgi:hypothetical protein